ncbi:MAG TPA: glycogen debranching protein GlgX [Mycobacteriales bacterium]|nr:glycogen debranching protein GlgX [Mycobacteriales bacterium]
MTTRVWPGSPYPLGATWTGEGVNFAIFSEHATGVELCLFDAADDATPRETIAMPEATDDIWHVYLPDVRPGALYGYRVHGPYEPEAGHRFNPAKLLIDPYAKAVSGAIKWSDELFGYTIGDPDLDLSRDDRDSAGAIPKCVVVDQAFTWGDDAAPRTPLNRTVIYECHVKGMTARHPQVPPELRGTYLGLASDPVIDHLTTLGVTAVELMPVHQFLPERDLVDRGLTNYWGYNSIGFLAPHVSYATGGGGEQVGEFKSMVKTLHRAGLEVILDVVYNHTAEGSHLGPTLSLRGIDNATYYRYNPDDHRFLYDFTGTGNSLNLNHPRTMGLIMDSLRYWVTDMHVDGFRFDLAPVLVRGYENGPPTAFFEIVQQDPVLSGVKLIAEPWDVGPDGYQLGRFPQGWSEWNGRYRDSIRQFWRGDDGMVPEVASRLSGSSDIFAPSRRTTYASVNFVTCHDGFTLTDLVSYDHRHNEANGENNQDGTSENYSKNWGAEGETESDQVNRMRERMKRNMLATVMFSQGVRMILAGDEIGRTQGGNNNAYCQDNEISWVNWEIDEPAQELFDFTKQLIDIMQAHPVLRRRHFFAGTEGDEPGEPDVLWIRPDGLEMTEDDWADKSSHALGMLMHGRAGDELDSRGRAVVGETLLLLLNAGRNPRKYTLPPVGRPGVWEELFSTARPEPRLVRTPSIMLARHSTILLRHNENPARL